MEQDAHAADPLELALDELDQPHSNTCRSAATDMWTVFWPPWAALASASVIHMTGTTMFFRARICLGPGSSSGVLSLRKGEEHLYRWGLEQGQMNVVRKQCREKEQNIKEVLTDFFFLATWGQKNKL